MPAISPGMLWTSRSRATNGAIPAIRPQGLIAWLLWGGDEGEAWAKKLKDEIDKTE